MILVIYFVLSNALRSLHRFIFFAYYIDLSSLSFVLSWTLRNWITCFALDRARTMERAAQSPRSSKKRPFLHL